MKSLTFKQYTWIHSILSFVSLYALIVKYEIKDLYYKDTYRFTNSDRLTIVPIFLLLSFAIPWVYYLLSKKKDNVIANKDYKQIIIYWFWIIIANFIISINFLPVFFKPFSISGIIECFVVLINILLFYSIFSEVYKLPIKKPNLKKLG
jgi:hypothetical protein